MSYTDKLEAFRVALEAQHNERLARLVPDSTPDVVCTEAGYKFDKVFIITSVAEKLGRYMVETRTGDIYAIKSWTQVNKRRWYGTLETVDQYDWSDFYARPLPGTDAERLQVKRETEIKSTHKKRGRKPKVAGLKS